LIGDPAPQIVEVRLRHAELVKLARERGFLLADLGRLFHGHGVASNERWFVQVIEPNLPGATAITTC
jgi:hypothetical protein